jgi:hypothetical protein
MHEPGQADDVRRRLLQRRQQRALETFAVALAMGAAIDRRRRDPQRAARSRPPAAGSLASTSTGRAG